MIDSAPGGIHGDDAVGRDDQLKVKLHRADFQNLNTFIVDWNNEKRFGLVECLLLIMSIMRWTIVNFCILTWVLIVYKYMYMYIFIFFYIVIYRGVVRFPGLSPWDTIATHRGKYVDDNIICARRHRPSFVPTLSRGFPHKIVIPRRAYVLYSYIQGDSVNCCACISM